MWISAHASWLKYGVYKWHLCVLALCTDDSRITTEGPHAVCMWMSTVLLLGECTWFTELQWTTYHGFIYQQFLGLKFYQRLLWLPHINQLEIVTTKTRYFANARPLDHQADGYSFRRRMRSLLNKNLCRILFVGIPQRFLDHTSKYQSSTEIYIWKASSPCHHI